MSELIQDFRIPKIRLFDFSLFFRERNKIKILPFRSFETSDCNLRDSFIIELITIKKRVTFRDSARREDTLYL